ncbi:hypothetical protein FNF_01504 [Fusobacterium necrophorum subsp. funduliforme B35]|nr:hypothetical protein [Fusobacterium necrophorum]EYD69872.1 hypothetical protein FNF_01504 [Fusobacterium necrophorum subsp. funduliforme B35]
MIKESLEIFQQLFLEKGDQFILDTYVPKDGTYLLVNINTGIIEKKLDILTKNIQGRKEIIGDHDKDYDFIKNCDYLGDLIQMNKSMDSKKIIHSNQLYAFYVKKESIREKKLTSEIIWNYRNIIENPKEKYKGKGKEIYENIEKNLPKLEKKTVGNIFSWIEKNVNENLLLEDKRKDYLKIFFITEDREKSLQSMKEEHKRYILPNIYNSNDYNVKINEEIWGLSSNNMGLNSKKPYLEHKTRKNSVPYLINMEEALLQYKLYRYLLSLAKMGKIYIYITENKIVAQTPNNFPPIGARYLLKIGYSKEVEIKSFHTLSYQDKKNYILHFEKIIPIPKNIPSEFDYGNLDFITLMEYSNKIFFNKMLFSISLNHDFELEIKNLKWKRFIVKYRNAFYQLKEFYNDDLLKKQISNMWFDAVKISIENGFIIKAKHQMNFGLSLEKMLHGRSEIMEKTLNVREKFVEHLLLKSNWQYSSDEEYLYAIGQVLGYINMKRNSKNKNMTFLLRSCSTKNIEILKERLKNLFLKYSYHIEPNTRLAKAIGNILLYNPSHLDLSFIIAGFLSDLAFFYKKEETINE